MNDTLKDRLERLATANWLLPAALCGALPSALLLLGASILFVVWLFRSESPEAIAANAGTPLQVAEPSVQAAGLPIVQPTAAASASAAPQAADAVIAPVTDEAVKTIAAPEAPQEQSDSSASKKQPAAKKSTSRSIQFLILPSPENNRLAISRATDYVYDEDLGRLGLIGPWENAIGFISVDESNGASFQDLQHVPLRGAPHALYYHRLANGDGVFAIAQTEAPGVILLDSKSLQIVKSLRVESYPTFYWAAGKSDEQHLYFTTQVSNAAGYLIKDGRAFQLPSGPTVKMHRIDLATMELDTRFQGEVFETSSIRSVGDQLLRSYYRIVYNDADKQYIAYQDSLYAKDGRKLTNLKFQAQHFLPGGPWLTGVNESEIVVGSINDGRIVAGVSLPDVHQRLAGRLREEGHVFAQIFIDLKRNYLVVGRLQHVLIIPIEKLGLQPEPNLLLSESPPSAVKQGELYEFALKTVSGKGSFELSQGPDGMVLEDGVVRWRPEAAYTAPVEVKVKTSEGDLTREDIWNILVE